MPVWGETLGGKTTSLVHVLNGVNSDIQFPRGGGIMDASNASVKDGVMVALLPTTVDWCKTDLPHMTLVYAGVIDDLNPSAFNELAKDAATISMLCPPIGLRVLGVEVFGDEEKVNVLRLQPTSEVMAMRRIVERWNASVHDFNPHATVGSWNEGVDVVPDMLWFDRVYVGWGEQNLTFWLKR